LPKGRWREPALVRLVHPRENVEINTGTILIEKHALRPQCFQLRDYAYPNAWMSVSHNLTPSELEKELSITGWTFFYMASAIRTTSFGFNRAKMIHAALKRIIADAKDQRCNCVEIDDVTTHSFLGMPYVRVSAHPRHIQKGMVFSGQ
jgi:hypothetical protein